MAGLGAPHRGTLTIGGLITAVRFLTIVPVPGGPPQGPDALGRAAGWFPLVGLAFGMLLWLGHRALSLVFPPLLTTLLVVATWKCLSGGIHLDGLADCLDGLTGRNPSERLAIMRDSRIGVFGALGLIGVLLIGFIALAELSWERQAKALLLAPVVGRLAPLLLSRTFVPATPKQGLGAAFMETVTLRSLGIGAVVVTLAAGAIFWPWGLVVAGIGLALAWSAARFFARRFGGLTGDGLGAGVELGELGVLVAFAAFHSLA